MDYAAFLESKRAVSQPVGFEPRGELSPHLFGFQRTIVEWALRRGRAAIFAGCGLGKTLMELQWATEVVAHTGRNVLILAPLAVAKQIGRESDKFGFEAHVCRSGADVKPGVNVANYERLHLFDSDRFGGIVLDESSILKAFDGKTRKELSVFSRPIHYRLAATATPAPNDLIELTNHAEFLDVMSGKEIVALFFTQDGNSTHNWRLKGHAREDFWRWMASWSVAVRRPSDLGFSDDGYILPPLEMEEIVVDSPPLGGYLFPVEASGLLERRQARRDSLDKRVAVASERANSVGDPYIMWCDLNDESDALRRAIKGAVEVRGSDSAESKENALMGFIDGTHRVLVTKPSIAGWGLNLQHCRYMDFVGLSDSFEQMHQAIARCYRFGQKRSVRAGVVIGEAEGSVLANIERKRKQFDEMFDSIVRHMKSGFSLGMQVRDEMDYQPSRPLAVPHWLARSASC